MIKVNKIKCGVIMPISKTNNYEDNHWSDVFDMIKTSMSKDKKHKFDISLVSQSDETHVIQDTILNNLYHDDIVICDVSAKNPNVMFELGIRIAFGKPIVIIKDNKTDYIFDTGMIEHIEYDSSLKFQNIVSMQTTLCNKVASTYDMSIKNDYMPLIKKIGNFDVQELFTKDASPDAYIKRIHDMSQETLKTVKLLSKANTVMSKDDILQNFIDTYISKNNIKPNGIINHIAEIVDVAIKGGTFLPLFNNTNEMEKFIANLIIERIEN